MNKAETNRFKKLYQRHLRLLKLQGKSEKTVDAYSRAVRRISEYFDCCPDQLTLEQREQYFSSLVESHSWSTVKVDRNGLQFFWKHVLKRDWQWINIVKAPKVLSLPDILTVAEVEQLIGATRKLRYRVFLLATYSMGLRLSETLTLQVGDIDGQRKQIHIRRGKGHKDRFVPLPDLTYKALRALWCKHRNPRWLFPSAVGSLERIRRAITHMDRGGAQTAMKAVVTQCGIKKKSPFTPYAIMPSYELCREVPPYLCNLLELHKCREVTSPATRHNKRAFEMRKRQSPAASSTLRIRIVDHCTECLDV